MKPYLKKKYLSKYKCFPSRQSKCDTITIEQMEYNQEKCESLKKPTLVIK